MKKILFIAALLLVMSLSTNAQRTMTMPQAMQKLLNAEYAIASLYVDSVNEEKLIEEAIKGMLQSLDPTPPIPTPRRLRSSKNRCKASSAAWASSST